MSSMSCGWKNGKSNDKSKSKSNSKSEKQVLRDAQDDRFFVAG
ncbi:MAG: hypothetical protein ABI142_03585 [Bryocella sp.]